MNPQILKLVSIAAAPIRRIVGLMSGTSLDGLDIALCEFTGTGLETKVEVLHFITIPYEESFKNELKAVSFKETVDLRKLSLLNEMIGTHSAQLVLLALKKWNYPVKRVDLIASHGQTIFHAPFSLHQINGYPNATLQIGDGDHIANHTGIITLSDFRQKHVAAGGEGAPLAIYGDYLLFSSLEENRILLNIGGISNFTYLPKGGQPNLVFSTDVGPGNTLMDQFVQINYPGLFYDENAALALSGNANSDLVNALLDHPFFSQPFPRTTGPELFNMAYLQNAILASGNANLNNEDILASLCEFTAISIIHAIKESIADQEFKVYISGGGMHNPLLVKKLNAGMGFTINNTAELGINPDAKEAVLFALLANESLASGDTNFGNTKGMPNITMGKISLPY